VDGGGGFISVGRWRLSISTLGCYRYEEEHTNKKKEFEELVHGSSWNFPLP
jgi:hypothetical protein